MYDKPFLNTEELAERWGIKVSTLRNARPEQLPARFVRPGSRQALYPMSEILPFERAHTESRDYEAERALGAKPVFGRRGRPTPRGKGGRR
jgi:hypothetical protein